MKSILFIFAVILIHYYYCSVLSSSQQLLLPSLLLLGMTYYRDINDVTEDQRNRVHASLFPPTADEVQWMHLGA